MKALAATSEPGAPALHCAAPRAAAAEAGEQRAQRLLDGVRGRIGALRIGAVAQRDAATDQEGPRVRH